MDARRFSHALKYYNELFDRSQSNESMGRMNQAKILHKIAIIHEHQDDPKSQRGKLQEALRFLRLDPSIENDNEAQVFGRLLQDELRSVQEELEKQDDQWV